MINVVILPPRSLLRQASPSPKVSILRYGNSELPMSALGQKPTWHAGSAMSAI